MTRKTAVILFTVVLAMLVTPLQLPAASCMLPNDRIRVACKSNCCANMSCCASSEKEASPTSQPLFQGGPSKQLVAGFVSAAVIGSDLQPYPAERVCRGVPLRAHSPPPLAATCIRLI